MKLVMARLDSTKDELYGATLGLLEAFCATNGVPMPRIIRKRLGGPRCGMTCMGHDGTSAVVIDMRCCDDPGGRCFPAAPDDSTVVGVLAHEFGHVVLNWLEHKGDKHLQRRVMTVAEREESVSDYGRGSAHEQFAEAFRLAVLNPDLLRTGRPLRWTLLQSLGLMFPEPLPWRDVIARAPRQAVLMTEEWVRNGVG